jgi:four helix bundle protein
MEHPTSPRQTKTRNSLHLVESAVNAASNLEEGDDGSSPRDFRAKDRIALREFKESRLRLRILRATGYLTEREDPLIAESTELIKIIATMIRNSAANEARRHFIPRTRLPSER